MRMWREFYSMNVTADATAKLKEIIQSEDEPGLGLRIAVQGGGCSGFQYAFSLDKPQSEFDMIADLAEGVMLMIDSMSMMYLEEATLDFKKDLNGENFIINNPSAKTTCGCGSSFSV
jgi:iron-sulfur cluster insertion protein